MTVMVSMVVAVVMSMVIVTVVIMAMIVFMFIVIMAMVIVPIFFLIEEVLLKRWIINLLLCLFLAMTMTTASTSFSVIMLAAKMVVAFT